MKLVQPTPICHVIPLSPRGYMVQEQRILTGGYVGKSYERGTVLEKKHH